MNLQSCTHIYTHTHTHIQTYICKGCSIYTSDILNYHLRGVSEFRLVAMLVYRAFVLAFFVQIQSVMIIAWNRAHHTFAGETFFKIDKSVIATERTFRAHFMLCQNNALPDRIFSSQQY